MDSKYSAGMAADPQKKFSNNDVLKNETEDENKQKPKAFKFGQVDQKLLMSRLYSTPYKKSSSSQQYALEMGATSVHKPHIKKLETPPPNAEPIVNHLI